MLTLREVMFVNFYYAFKETFQFHKILWINCHLFILQASAIQIGWKWSFFLNKGIFRFYCLISLYILLFHYMNFLIFLAIHGWWNFNKGLKICKFYLIWFKVESIERSNILTTVKESVNLTFLFGLYDVWIWYFDVSLSCFLTWSCRKLFAPWYVIIFTIIILKPGSWVPHFHNIGWILELCQTVGITTVQLNELHCDS
jgi:hypothetical protein